MRISDWSSDVCSSDLACIFNRPQTYVTASSTCNGAALKTGYGYTTISSKVHLTSATDLLDNTTTYTQSVHDGVNFIKIGRAHVRNPFTHLPPECSLQHVKKNIKIATRTINRKHT